MPRARNDLSALMQALRYYDDNAERETLPFRNSNHYQDMNEIPMFENSLDVTCAEFLYKYQVV